MWARFLESRKPALMAVLRNEGQWDRSNVIYKSGQVRLYDKTGQQPEAASMEYIDYGISILARSVVESLPAGEASDLAPVLNRLSTEGRLAGFEVSQRFYEIGSPEGLRDFEEHVAQSSRAPGVHTKNSRGRVGILGGGLAGLTVAAHLEQESEVLESDSRPGGHCQSVIEEGFTYDAGGPHIMFSRNQKTLDFMIDLLDGNVYQGRRNNKIFYKGRYVKYPFENGLFDLEPLDRFECLYHYIKNDHPAPKNFKEWIYHTFGTGLAEKYLLPYNEKIWNVTADQMSLDWVEGRVPKPPVEDVIKAAVGVETEGYTHQLHFFYPAHGGVEMVPRGMARRVPNITTGFSARHVRRSENGWRVSDGERELLFERLVATLPINEMAYMFEDVPQDIKDCVNSLRYNSLFTVTIGLASERLPDYTAVYVPDPELLFHRLSFPAQFSPSNVPAGRSLVQAEITSNPGDGVWELDDSEVLRRVISGLEGMNLIRPSEICYSKVIRTKYGYVVQDFNYRRYLEKAKRYFEDLGVALCGRNAEFEYINMDQCIERGIKVAERLNQERLANV
jgi:protoporphyrinogen oxidase